MNRFACLLAAATALFFLAACGDTENFTQINQTGVDVYASADDLPECTDENEGDQAFVKGEASARLCVDGEWFVTDHSSAKDTVYVGGDKLNCTTEELADKSGLKIVCNGDSIGVVLNGAKGDKGETGEEGKKGDTGCTISQNDTALTVICGDSTTTVKLGTGKPAADTTVNDTSDAAVSLDSLAGYSQKGPFLKGSTVYLYELDNGKSLKQTNGNFTSYIMNDEGYYKFTSRKVNPYALVIVDGNYRNEVMGAVSAQTIRLKALSDVRKHHKGANVNILTHLEYERVYYLVTKMDYDFDEAKQKAQEEIFRAFNMVIESDKDAETLNIFGKTDADAALLALSIMLQGERSEADMMVLLTEISNDLATDGKWDDSTSNVDSVKASIADWLLRVDSDKRLERFHANVKGWHLGRDTTVPDFKRFLRNYVNVESGLGACASENRGTFANVPNVKSEYYAVAYDSIDASSNSLVRVVCDAEDGFHWRIATALERDTMGWSAQDDGTVQMGRIDTSMVYVYDGGWRHGTAIERILGLGCTEAREGSMKQDEGGSWYKCNRTSEMKVEESRWSTAWLEATPIEIDSLYWLTNRNETGTLLLGSNTGRVVVWDAGSLRNATALENDLGRGCVSYINGDSDTLGLHSSYTCLADGWYFDSVNVITDPRDGTTYRTIKIGTQYWMAENLNYNWRVARKFRMGTIVITITAPWIPAKYLADTTHGVRLLIAPLCLRIMERDVGITRLV